MAKTNSGHDESSVPTLSALSSVDLKTIVPLVADPTTNRLLVDLAGGGSVAAAMQKDIYFATNGQTTFAATKTVAFDFYISVNGAIQTPSTDYSIIGGSYVLNSGIPQGSVVVLLYAIS